MSEQEIVEYAVVLVFPGFGVEREYAEEVVEDALEYLNVPRYEPGMRFAPHVRARLEIVMDAEQAMNRLEADDDVAALIIHDLDDDEKNSLTEECAARGIAVCHTCETSGRPRKKRAKDKKGWTFTLRPKSEKGPSAHQIADTVLTSPPDDEEEWSDRVGQVIMVLALGVMQCHWSRNPPKRHWIE
jgi:hypothetical protein